jgi:non-heme chloroperoxidase
MGGAVAVRYMARHGGFRVSRRALLGAAAPSFPRREGQPYGMTREEVDALIARLYADRPEAVRDFGRMLFASPVTESFAAWFQNLSLETSGHGTIRSAVALRDSDLQSDLSKIRVPTGIFHGVLDRVCPFEFALELRRGIRGSELFRFEKSGHALFYDEREKFNEEFSSFLLR